MFRFNYNQPTQKGKRYKASADSGALLLFTMIFFPAFAADAIIIRHDKPDNTYQEMAKPFEASIAYLDRCVATVLSNDWLITAKHCVSKKNQYPVSIRHLGRQYPVADIVESPDIAELDDLDIALLKLHWPLEQAVPVLIHSTADELAQQVIFVGNGMTGTGLSGDSVEDKKLRAATNTVSKVEANWLSFKFDQGESATKYEGVSGKGDSGGPALIITPKGISLVGVGCCQEPVKLPSGTELQGGYHSTEYYARVSPHAAWIEQHLNADESKNKIDSAILTAIKSGEYGIAKRLLRKNSAWLKQPELVTEILLHSFYRSFEFSRFLIEQFETLREHSIQGLPLPVYAYLQGNGNVFSLLIRHGVGLDFKGFRNQALPSLISWQYFGDDYSQLIRQLLLSGFEVNAVDDHGDSAMHMAVFFDSPARVELLLSLGADINLADNRGNTALIDAARIGNKKMIEMLLLHGANTAQFNHQQQTAVDVANTMGHIQIAEHLKTYKTIPPQKK